MPPVAKAQIDSGMEDSTAKHGFEATIWLAADPFGDSFISGQDKREQQRPFRVGKRNPRVKLQLQKPKQSNLTTRRLAIMNLAIRGIEADIGKEHADTFRHVQHPDLRADYLLATARRDSANLKAKPDRRACRRQDIPMPFNDSDWHRKNDDVRWRFRDRRKHTLFIDARKLDTLIESASFDLSNNSALCPHHNQN